MSLVGAPFPPLSLRQALLAALGTFEDEADGNGAVVDPGETLVLGRRGDCTPSPAGGPAQGDASDCAVVCKALRLLVQSEPSTRDVLVDQGVETILTLVDSPVEGAPFAIAIGLMQV